MRRSGRRHEWAGTLGDAAHRRSGRHAVKRRARALRARAAPRRARSSRAPRTSRGIEQAVRRERRAVEPARQRARSGRVGGHVSRSLTFSPKRSRSTERRSPMPSTSPSSRASAPTQNAPENSCPVLDLQPRAAPARRTRSTKTSWMRRLELLQALDVLRILRPERVEHGLVAAGRVDPPLDAEPLDQPVEAEARRDHADRADDRGRVGEDLVARAGDHVAAGRRRVLDEHEDRAASSPRRASGCAGRSGATAPAEPPGELTTSATALAPRIAKARSSIGATLAIESPERSGIAAPIAPVSRTTATDGASARNRFGRRKRRRPGSFDERGHRRM